MSKPNRHSHSFSGFFALRTPLLPYDELARWSEGLEAPLVKGDDAQLEAAMGRDRAKLRERLRALLDRPEVREALFVASPVLDESLPLWRENPDSERGIKAERTLVRYFGRMASRCTPFGLFAGCSVGLLGERTELELAPRDQYGRHTRLDTDYVDTLTATLQKDPVVRRALIYRPNTSLYSLANRWRYVEAQLQNRSRAYQLISVETTDYLAAILEQAGRGARFDDMVASLTAMDSDVSVEDAEGYLASLIDTQLLISDLALAVTGTEPMQGLLAQLKSLPIPPETANTLKAVEDTLHDLDAGRLGLPPQRYRTIARSLEPLGVKVELPRLFQVDMVKPLQHGVLGPQLQESILHGLSLLHRLRARTTSSSLRSFREAFQSRYEGREVPLQEALDDESGIGFESGKGPESEGSPLLQGLRFMNGEEASVPMGARSRLLLSKIHEAVRNRSIEATITEEEIDSIEDKDRPPLPDALSLMVSIDAPSVEAIAAGDYRVQMEGGNGPSGANILGRFCHGDEVLTKGVLEHLRAEEALQPDAIFAEIVHLPEGRIGNILARPILRQYEIPYLGRSGVPPAQQIPLSDLMVSVQGSEIVLRSRALNKRVLPRMTNAHNYMRGPGPYRFLCALAGQGVAGAIGMDWGGLAGAPFLPRLVCGRIVLSPARWRVEKEVLEEWAAAGNALRFRQLRAYRERMGLPRVVLLHDSDNDLPVDFDNVLSLDSFVQLVKNRPSITLIEQLPSPDRLLVKSAEGRFTHEAVFPIVRREALPAQRTRTLAAPVGVAHAPRRFPPGSEWLYAKLYVGTGTAERVLDAVRPIVKDALASGIADRFFFIRFGDPDWHIRIRFHGAPERLLGTILPALHRAGQPLLESHTTWKVILDTYERETERYGGPEGMQLSEALFHVDSVAALEMIEHLGGEDAPEARWQMCFAGMNGLLDDLGFDLDEKLEVVKGARASFGTEFKVDGEFERSLGEGFRSRRKRLDAILDPSTHADDPYSPGYEVLARRSAELKPVGAQLRAAAAAGRLTVSLLELARSYLHMHANRMLRSSARAQELVLYDLLTRCYESRVARKRATERGKVGERSAGPGGGAA